MTSLPEDVGQVAAPEGEGALAGHGPAGAVQHAVVGLVQGALLQHLALVEKGHLNMLESA